MVFYTPGRTTSYSSEKIEDGIRFHFLGGAKEVGNVACVIEDNTQTRILIDYGLSPGDPPTYPQESPPIDAAIIPCSFRSYWNGSMDYCKSQLSVTRYTSYCCFSRHDVARYIQNFEDRRLPITMG